MDSDKECTVIDQIVAQHAATAASAASSDQAAATSRSASASAHASAPPYRTATFTATAATSNTVAVVTTATVSIVSAKSSADQDITADQDGTYDVAMQDVAGKLRATGLTPAEALALGMSMPPYPPPSALDGGGLGRPLDNRLLDRHGSTTRRSAVRNLPHMCPAHMPCA